MLRLREASASFRGVGVATASGPAGSGRRASAAGLGGSDEGLLTLARTLNSEFAVSLPESEVRGIWRSVCRYRARWRVQGHQQAWLWKQAARARKGGLIGGRKAGVVSGVVRLAGSLTERQPWADLGVSRRTWYRRFRGAKTGGANMGAKVGTRTPNTDRSGSGYLLSKA